MAGEDVFVFVFYTLNSNIIIKYIKRLFILILQWKAGKFAATLRRQIFKEHLGLSNETDHEKVTTLSSPPPIPFDEQELSKDDHIVLDPISDEFYYNFWQQTATVNAEAFRTVFHCVPDETGSYNF